jgi:hypothetical protein
MERDEIDELLRFFTYSHLPEKLQDVSAPFCKLAHDLVARYKINRELFKSLDLLLAAKDAAVRAVLFP